MLKNYPYRSPDSDGGPTRDINPEKVSEGKIYNQLLREQKNTLNEIKQLSNDLTANASAELRYQEQFIKGTEDIGRSLRSKEALEQASIQNMTNQFDLAQAMLVANEDERDVLEAKMDIQESIGEQLKKQSKERAAIEENMDKNGGALLKHLGKIPGMSGASTKGLNTMQTAMEKGVSSGKAFNLGLKHTAKEAAKAGAQMLLAFAIKSILEFGNASRDLSRSMGINADEAHSFQTTLKFAAAHSGDVLATSMRLVKTNQQLNQFRGTAVKFSKEELVDANRLLQTKVLTQQAVGELSRLTNISGQSIREGYLSQIDGVLAAEKEHGVRLNIKQVLEDASKVTGQIRSQMGGNLEAMAKSVATAKQFGMELSEVAAAGKSMLNFHSSIEAELEAELFLGKQLNLEQARLAALTGDYDTLMKEINKNVGNFYDFSKLNVMQQDKLAAAMGMTSDQLSDQLLKKADLNALTKEAREDGREDIAANMERLSIQDKIEASMEKFKASMADILTVLNPIIEGFASLITFISESTGAAYALAAIMGIMATASIINAVAGIWKSFSLIPFGIGIPLAIAASIGMFQMISSAKSKSKSIKDGEINPQGGLMVSGPKGSIQLDKEDSVVAGTNLGGKGGSKKSVSIKADSQRMQRYQSETVALLKSIAVATAAASLSSAIASVSYSGFDAVKADTHYKTKFR